MVLFLLRTLANTQTLSIWNLLWCLAVCIQSYLLSKWLSNMSTLFIKMSIISQWFERSPLSYINFHLYLSQFLDSLFWSTGICIPATIAYNLINFRSIITCFHFWECYCPSLPPSPILSSYHENISNVKKSWKNFTLNTHILPHIF